MASLETQEYDEKRQKLIRTPAATSGTHWAIMTGGVRSPVEPPALGTMSGGGSVSAHTHGRRHLEPLLRPTPQVNCTFSQPTKEVPREWPLLGHLFLTRSWPLVATLSNPKIQP